MSGAGRGAHAGFAGAVGGAFAVAMTLAFAAPVLSTSCSADPIVLATIPADDAGDRYPPQRCVGPADCPEGLFCSKHDCDDSAGTCQPYPAYCPDDEHPVCGCDGITYFNDCLRKAAGVAAAGADECVDGVTCGGPTEACPSGAVCARLLGFQSGGPTTCGPDVRGSCWVIPATCPPPTRPDRWDECGPTGDRCVDTCTAILGGRPHQRVTSCN